MAHWLTRLLSPKSIAIVGASSRQGSLANKSYQQLIETRFSGSLFLVNPNYKELFSQPCYADLKTLPEIPDLVLYVISGLPLEKSFDQALQIGVGGIVIYASNQIEESTDQSLPQRLKEKAKAVNIPVLGGNSMGYYNYDDNVFVSFDSPPRSRDRGGVALIAHSGSAMTYLANNDCRFCYNYVIASGQETHASVADYMDYLLEQPSTGAICLFLETVRNVADFIAALRKAQNKKIPIVITKLGRTEKSAALAVSHSGAIAGDHDAFVALCNRYGVILTNDIDEMITTAMLLATYPQVDSDGVASILDSGGMREQMIDIAEDYGLRFSNISTTTKSQMSSFLEHGLVADNPLDAMGALGNKVEETYFQCGKALLDDTDTGLLTYEFEFRDGFSHYPQMFEVIRRLAEYSSKPLIIINSFTFASTTETATQLSRQGLVLINGIDLALRSIRNFCHFHVNHIESVERVKLQTDTDCVNRWKSRLSTLSSCDELTSLGLMKDFNLPVVPYDLIENSEQLLVSAKKYRYPMVLKTAQPDIQHKSDSNGVKLNLDNETELLQAYSGLSSRLGGRALVMPMADDGVEVSVGMKNDAQYGPLIIISAGGILIELIKDRVISLAPVNHDQVRQMIGGLKINKVLQGVRGRPACDIEALIELIVNFSNLVTTFSDVIAEIDLNPVIVHQKGCTIVDALVVPERC